MQATNAETLKDYFRLLQSVQEENDLFNKPSQLYNMDETGMPLEHRAPNVITKKGKRKVLYCSPGNKSQITVVGCVNASGQPIPPMVIFDSKSFNIDWAKGEVPGTFYGLSPKGWIDGKLFKLWFTSHFLKHAVAS